MSKIFFLRLHDIAYDGDEEDLRSDNLDVHMHTLSSIRSKFVKNWGPQVAA